MRKVRVLVIAFLALALTGAMASSALAKNVYTVDGSGARGGTPKKPVASPLKIDFTIEASTDGVTPLPGVVPDPPKSYTIKIEGARLNKAVLKKIALCKAPGIMAANQVNTMCSKGSIIGSGVLTASAGTPGQPEVTGCPLPFNVYHTGYKSGLGLFIKAAPPLCTIPVNQWVEVKAKQSGKTLILSFSLRYDKLVRVAGADDATGIFAAPVKTTLNVKKIVKKIGKKKQGLGESIGCKVKGKRQVSATFVTLAGDTQTVSKTVPC